MSADELAAAVEAMGALPMPVPVGPEPLGAERLAEIRDRAGIATEGPWRVVEGHEIHQGAEFGGFAVYVAQTDPDCGCVQSVADAEFIAHSREDVPALLADNERLRARVAELERTVQQMVDGLNGHDCPPPDETPMGLVTRFAVRLMEAERLLAEDGCSCPPVDRTHQIGCPLDGVPAPGPDAVTPSFAERAAAETDPARRTAWRMLAEPEPEFHAYLHHPYQREHDLPEMGGA
ncbi:hypothetical protein [Streptomyces stelliscabiei]|uniref:hypothetical protein n=1 Tax=Streptomyces stelliscabiei TaxID=146820 RepID=UPI0029B621A2|nr:hypothetical protein [Streptomyces stelliscabiei]MDX2550193.1 hypothetical protein [Streptomyces stelliscabiei]